MPKIIQTKSGGERGGDEKNEKRWWVTRHEIVRFLAPLGMTAVTIKP